MKVLITAAGSLGDVAPYTGLGARLRAAGHEVALATHDRFAPLAREAGLEFRRLPADPDAQGPAVRGRDMLRTAAAFVRELAQGVADTTAQGADVLLLSTTTAPIGWQISEATGVASLGVYLQPTAPTGDFAPVVAGGRSLGRPGNRVAGRLSLRMVDRVYADAISDLRSRLGLPAATPTAVRRRQDEAGWRVLHGYSPVLVPQPADWRAGLETVGNWWPHHDPGYRLPMAVEDFLRSGPPPVLVGFGSMAAGEGERLSALTVEALRRAGLRGILQSGRAGLVADGDDVIPVGAVPHAVLFPRLAAVVHHAGAGTTGAVLRAGVPSVPVPVTADQPFWAGRLAALGAATAPIPYKDLTAVRLADALSTVVRDPSYARAAASAARRSAAEDGAGRVAEALERLTPVRY
ncbi:glycosyltransferase [Streptomyces syringium]|uniref:glycosyltransferase n=1 Tax=Streptomyces syringium TaxID=76729 RepID=UPI0033CA1BE2